MLGNDEYHFIKVAQKASCKINPGESVAKINFIKLIDKSWKQLPYRFADIGGEIVALAQPKTNGDTSLELK